MPELPVNKEMLLRDIIKNLKVGDTILTNGDGSFASDEFFMGTVIDIHGLNISIKRADGEFGSGVDQAWLIEATDDNDTTAVILDETKATPTTFAKLRFGHVIKIVSIDAPNNPVIVLQVMKKTKKALVKDFFGARVTTVSLEDVDDILFFYRFSHNSCTYDGCKTPATMYIGSHYLCDDHKDMYGKVVICHDCDVQMHEDSSFLRSVRGSRVRIRVCHACNLTREAAERIIQEYNYKPQPKFITVDAIDKTLANRIFTGVENEVECPRTMPGTVEADEKLDTVVKTIGQLVIDKGSGKEPWFYLKHDGSLSNGFELVTHPATLKGHYSLPWRDLCNLYKKYGVMADDTTSCGLHIHANKNSMEEGHQMKLGYFVYKNQGLMEKIARRTSNHYSDFARRSHLTQLKDMSANTGVKYEALNWCPPETVEFRLFKGTTKFETMLSSLEFVHAAIMFTSHVPVTTLKNPDKCQRAFFEFVTADNYPFLHTYLHERSITI